MQRTVSTAKTEEKMGKHSLYWKCLTKAVELLSALHKNCIGFFIMKNDSDQDSGHTAVAWGNNIFSRPF